MSAYTCMRYHGQSLCEGGTNMKHMNFADVVMLTVSVLSLALLSACASMPGSEWTVADGERAVRDRLDYLKGVEMRDTFVSTETSRFGKTMMCGYINVQSGPQILGPGTGTYTVRPEFVRFIYVYRTRFFQT